MKQIFDATLQEAILKGIDEMSEAEIDAVMTLIPEAQYERIAAGTPCMSSDGRRFTVIGMTKISGLSDSSMYNNKILMSFDHFLAKDR